MTTENVSTLLQYLRLKIGDTSIPYRYVDAWLETALIMSVKTLQRYWRDKYTVSDLGEVSRNINYQYWIFEETDGVIESADEPVIVIMAAIIILEGSLENSAWDSVSWADSEIRYTNSSSGSLRESNLKRLVDELFSLVVPPTKKLARALKSSLPGYIGNMWETETRNIN